jgi:hypothetical protein
MSLIFLSFNSEVKMFQLRRGRQRVAKAECFLRTPGMNVKSEK